MSEVFSFKRLETAIGTTASAGTTLKRQDVAFTEGIELEEDSGV